MQLAAAAIAAAALLGACGDDDRESRDSSGNGTTQDSVLAAGVIHVDLKIDVEQTGGEGGSVVVRARGPFASRGDGELPGFALDVEGAYVNSTSSEPRTDFESRLVYTGDAAYFSYRGQDYEVDPELLDQLLSAGEAATAKGLGDLLTGTSETEDELRGEPVNHVSGRVDLEALLTRINEFLADPGELELESLPEPGALDRFKGLVTEATFDAFLTPGLLLRQLDAQASLKGVSVKRVSLALDMTFEELPEPQPIEAPADPRPFAEFLQQPFIFIYASYVGLPEARAYSECLYEDSESIYDVEEGAQERCRELLER